MIPNQLDCLPAPAAARSPLCAIAGGAASLIVFVGLALWLLPCSGALLAAAAAPGSQAEAIEKPAKAAIPSKEVRDAKRAEIAQVFPTDAAKTPQAKGALADRLLSTGRDSKDSAEAFVLFNMAREVAVTAVSAPQAVAAIDALAEQFDFDADPIYVASLESIARENLTGDARKSLFAAGKPIVERLQQADKHELADRLVAALLASAKRLKSAEDIASFADLRKQGEAFSKRYESAKQAFETLKTQPNDPAANVAAGRYLLIAKDDQAAGFAHLAKGGSDPLALIAQQELAPPEGAGCEALADAWWKAAESEKSPDAKWFCQERAAHWYEAALPQLTGLGKLKVEKRLAEFAGQEKQVDKTVTAKPMPKGALLLLTFDKDTVVQNADGTVVVSDLSGHGNDFRGRMVSEGDVNAKNPKPLISFGKGKAGRAIAFSGGALDSNVSLINHRTEFTIAAWIMPALPVPAEDVFGNQLEGAKIFSEYANFDRDGFNGGLLVMNERSLLLKTFRDAKQIEKWPQTPAGSIVRERWVFVAARYRDEGKGAGPVQITINDKTMNATSQTVEYNRATKMYVGRRYLGAIDELAFFDRVLSDTELTALYRRGNAGTPLMKE